MKTMLSVVMITKNSEELLAKSLSSVSKIADEIIVVDDFSVDYTVKIAKTYHAKVYRRKDDDLGRQKAYAIGKAKGQWILLVDADEIVSVKLAREIRSTIRLKEPLNGYLIPYQNHFLGKSIRYGGENYKMLRLFRKSSVKMPRALVHEAPRLQTGKLGRLRNKLYHYSYRSLLQMYIKFTDYAIREARQKKKAGERTSLKKIMLYPPHMLWARFIKDKGYKDGLFRIPLDLGFAYMEFLTYVSLPFVKI